MQTCKRIDKPWGYEEILEQNKDYVLKRLFMKKGQRCSLQYHQFKRESFLVLSGQMKFYIKEADAHIAEYYLQPGEYYTVQPNVVHRMEAVEDCMYIEASTNYLDDVIRLQDEYGRTN